MATARLELEALFVTIQADATSFLAGTQAVIDRVAEVNIALDSLARATQPAAIAIENLAVAAELAAPVIETVALAANLAAPEFAAMATAAANNILPFTSLATAVGGLTASMSSLPVGLTAVSTPLLNFASTLGSITPDFAALAKAFDRVGMFLSRVTRADLAKLGPAADDLHLFADAFSATARSMTNMPEMTSLSLMFQRIGHLVNSVNKTDAVAFGVTLDQMSNHLDSFARYVGLIDTAAIEGQLKSFGLIGRFTSAINRTDSAAFGVTLNTIATELVSFTAAIANIDVSLVSEQFKLFSRLSTTVSRFSKITPGAFTGAASAFQQLSAGVAAIPVEQIKALASLGTSLEGVTKFIGTFTKLTTALSTVTAMPTLPNPDVLVDWVKKLAVIDPAMLKQFSQVGASLRNVAYFIRSIQSVGTTALTAASAASVVSWINQVASVSPASLTTLVKIGDALRAITAAKGAAGTIANFNRQLGNTGPAATGSIPGLANMRGNIKTLASSATSASVGLNTLKLSLAGFAGFGLYLFARMDDQLTRVLMHMREFPGTPTAATSRRIFETGIPELARRTPFGPTELIKGLDVLASSGMNAAMSVKALDIAQKYALVSGTEVGEATKGLVDAQRALGLNMENSADHYREMIRLSDALVAVSFQTGSSTKQMADALGSKFALTMKTANLELEDGVALLGLYSERLPKMRGAEAGDMLSRAFYAIAHLDTTKLAQWKALFGENMFDKTTGQIKDVEALIEKLSGALGHIQGDQAQVARLIGLGFERRDAAAIQPLINSLAEFKRLKADIAATKGITDESSNMMLLTFNNQMRILWNNVSLAAEAVGNALAPAIKFLALGIESVTKWFTSLNPAVRSLVVWVGLVVLTAGPLLALFGALGPMLAAPFTMLIGAIAYLMPLFGAVLAAILPITAALLGLVFVAPLIVAWFGMIMALSSSMFSKMLDPLIVQWKGTMPLFHQGLRDLEASFAGTGGQGKKMWGDIKGAFGDFIADAGIGVDLLAGFFWNFQENVKVIFAWFRRNWKEIIVDAISLTLMFTKNMLDNFKVIGTFLTSAALNFWDSAIKAWSAAMVRFSNWVEGNFKNIMKDLFGDPDRDQAVFLKFFGNLLRNLVVFADAAGQIFVTRILLALGRLATSQPLLFSMFPGGAAIAAQMRKGLESAETNDPAQIIKAATEKLRNPFEGIEPAKFKTEWSRLLPEVGEGLRVGKDIMGRSFESIAKMFDDARNDLKSPLEGFKPITENLLGLLNFAMPRDMKLPEMLEGWLRRALPPVETEDVGGNMFAKTGPGFQFKQISEIRTMVGGPVAEKLDYQQLTVLQMINNNLTQLVSLARQGKDRPEVLSVMPKPILGE